MDTHPIASSPAEFSDAEAPKSRLTPTVLLLLWFLFICATSSTVVTPTQFFNAVSDYLVREESAFQAFALFWGAWWFLIVKGWHATEFAILAWLCATVLWQFSRFRTSWIAPTSFLIALVLAMFDEWRQTFVPDRGGTWTDVAIDVAGAFAAMVWWTLQYQRRKC